jgi:hypothetical protein
VVVLDLVIFVIVIFTSLNAGDFSLLIVLVPFEAVLEALFVLHAGEVEAAVLLGDVSGDKGVNSER